MEWPKIALAAANIIQGEMSPLLENADLIAEEPEHDDLTSNNNSSDPTTDVADDRISMKHSAQASCVQPFIC